MSDKEARAKKRDRNKKFKENRNNSQKTSKKWVETQNGMKLITVK